MKVDFFDSHQFERAFFENANERSAHQITYFEPRLTSIIVVRFPAYSPYAVAEHAVGLLLSLNRKIHKAYARVHELNFSLEGLVGFDLHEKVIGVIGVGNIGSIFCRIMKGFGCHVLGYDPVPNEELLSQGIVKYVDLGSLYRESDIISLHAPLNP